MYMYVCTYVWGINLSYSTNFQNYPFGVEFNILETEQ